MRGDPPKPWNLFIKIMHLLLHVKTSVTFKGLSV